MKWIAQYSGWLRQVRFFHWLNNLLHANALRRNRAIYCELGIQRSVFSSIDSRIISKFLDLERDSPPDKKVLLADPPEGVADLDWEAAADQWTDEGFIHLKSYFTPDLIARINNDIENGLRDGAIHFNYTGRKIFNAQNNVSVLHEIVADQGILNILRALFGRPAVHFQTISFLQGSEQRAHSDSVHMTTAPLGYLAGVWVALEDIHPGNGPLTYYPGSHKLPYLLNSDYGNTSNPIMLDGEANKKYEDKVAAVLAESGLEEQQLRASAGDVFIWHANLCHGGAPIRDQGATRRSMVSHYFAEGVLCFHEISERPAIITGPK